jgi:HEAT repeat protein
MSVSLEDVNEALAPEEPDYANAAGLGPDALPHLQRIVEGSDPMLASKATYLASLIEDDRALSVLETAARSEDATVRVAAAAGVANLGDSKAAKMVVYLLSDDDVGVRRRALASVPEIASTDLRHILEKLRLDDPDPSIRRAASHALDRISVSS